MKLMNKIFITLITAGIFAQPINAMSMQRVRDLLSSAAAKITQSEYNKPACLIGAVCVAGLATVGLGWYLYNAITIAKRTYRIGSEKFIAPEGAKVLAAKNKDTTSYKYKREYSISLKDKEVKCLSVMDGKKPSNLLQVFHESYKQDPSVRIIMHSDTREIPAPEIGVGKKSGEFVARIPNSQSVARVDYIFTFGIEEE